MYLYKGMYKSVVNNCNCGQISLPSSAADRLERRETVLHAFATRALLVVTRLSVCLFVLGLSVSPPLCLSFHLSQVCCPLCHVACPVALELPVGCHLNDFMFCPLVGKLEKLVFVFREPEPKSESETATEPDSWPDS